MWGGGMRGGYILSIHGFALFSVDTKAQRFRTEQIGALCQEVLCQLRNERVAPVWFSGGAKMTI